MFKQHLHSSMTWLSHVEENQPLLIIQLSGVIHGPRRALLWRFILKYLTVIHPVWLEPIANIRLNSRIDKKKLSEAIYLAEKYECIGIVSNYANPMTANFERYEDSRNIKGFDVPERLKTDELIDKLDSLRLRGKDKKLRYMSHNSLKNLRPAARFKAGHKHYRKSSIPTESVLKAIELREQTMPWRAIGDCLGMNFETVRSAVRKHQESTGSTGLRT